MNQKPIFVITQGFSKQGSSVIKTLVSENEYQLVALTSKPVDDDSRRDQVARLQEKQVRVVQCNVSDKDALVQVFRGAYGAFLVKPLVSPFEPNFKEREFAALQVQIDAAIEAQVTHIIISGTDSGHFTNDQTTVLDDSTTTYRTPIQKYLEEKATNDPKSTTKYVSTINLIEFSRPLVETDSSDGSQSFTFAIPFDVDQKIPYVDPYTSTGRVVSLFLHDPVKYNRATLAVVAEYLTPGTIASTFSEVTGLKATYRFQTEQNFLDASGLGQAPPEYQMMGKALYSNFRKSVLDPFVFKYCDTSLSNQLVPNQSTFKQFLQNTNWKGESYQDFRFKLNK
ncbi:hypothetical protein DFA_04577 [Cavenderia fasciculata]|uniref:NmrA-like domain-containing protein n=1 Tax=Cavenderia fasciculata TaxID=261658 RepID=F4PPY8_CACFS|nr:uncharacterized protein DFA_04577 [Cavenderia fasciculata]EGG22451.1 hypothetical protein DFA_04577 [Cavenderia fasciculata]|eukprot:XP_004360302.1 hypothetical protein DFA_04577 [Cavenderia fasciculata]